MARKLYKFKLLLDENLPNRTSFPRLNGRYDTKHVVHDYKKQGIPDDMVMRLAVQSERIVITLNKKDFLNFKLTKNSGVIGVSPNLSIEQIDVKITSFLSKSTKNQIYGHIHYITKASVE